MTGHQVYSTLHANSAVGAIARLKDLGVSPAVIGDSVIAIVGQRLVRKLCVKCRVPASDMQSMEDGLKRYSAGGCDECDGQGYKGRIAVAEVLRFTDELRELIVSDESASVISQHALQQGYTNLSMEAKRLVGSGLTSITELSRVIDFTM